MEHARLERLESRKLEHSQAGAAAVHRTGPHRLLKSAGAPSED